MYFNQTEVKALILTCGGLCPGLNVVIREIVMTLWHNYGVTEIYGAPYGYQWIYSNEYIKLYPDLIKNIHK